MINYKPYKFKELAGSFNAVVLEVRQEENRNFDPSYDNATELNLTIDFQLSDPTTGETFDYTQKFVQPLTGGKGLLQQLMDVQNFIPDKDGGSYDEKSLEGLHCTVVIGKNKKGYPIIENVSAAADSYRATAPIPASADGALDDLPF